MEVGIVPEKLMSRSLFILQLSDLDDEFADYILSLEEYDPLSVSPSKVSSHIVAEMIKSRISKKWNV